MANNSITKKTMLPLGVVAGIVVCAVSIFLWANDAHDTLQSDVLDTVRIEQEQKYGELKEDIKEVKDDVKEVNGKIDDLKDLLIQMNGGLP